jgi:hypothetical protein
MATEIYAEPLEKRQHLMRLRPESKAADFIERFAFAVFVSVRAYLRGRTEKEFNWSHYIGSAGGLYSSLYKGQVNEFYPKHNHK